MINPGCGIDTEHKYTNPQGHNSYSTTLVYGKSLSILLFVYLRSELTVRRHDHLSSIEYCSCLSTLSLSLSTALLLMFIDRRRRRLFSCHDG